MDKFHLGKLLIKIRELEAKIKELEEEIEEIHRQQYWEEPDENDV